MRVKKYSFAVNKPFVDFADFGTPKIRFIKPLL